MALVKYNSCDEAWRDISLLADAVQSFGYIIANGSGDITLGDALGKTKERHLTIESLEEIICVATACYAWAGTVWSKTKSASILSGAIRKKHESVAYINARSGSGPDGERLAKSQKDAETRAMVDAASAIESSTRWDMLVGHISSVKESLERILKTLESVSWIRKQEWDNSRAR